jgi:diguanylate cyclase (GGDEF)-like protein
MRRVLIAALATALVAEVLHALLGFGGPGMETFMREPLYLALETAGALVCVARVVRRSEHRVAWACIAASLVCWTAGDAAFYLLPEPIPYPSVADVLYLGFYPFAIAGMALLLTHGRDRIAARLWIDGVIGGLAVAAVVIALSFDTIVAETQGTTTETAVNLAYPLADLVLIAFVLTAFGTQAWRPSRGWGLLGLGVLLTAIADTIYLYQDAIGSLGSGALLDTMWPAGLLCCGWAAWQDWPEGDVEHRFGRQTFALPTIFSAVAIGVLCYGQLTPIPALAAILATVSLLLASTRTGLTFRENLRLLRTARQEAMTDGLTGLPNRRSLMRDLDRAVAASLRGQPSTFAFFDLDGFKGYNDTFGHAAGDLLLDRLARRLADSVGDHGTAYRLGGDEFCVLFEGPFSGHAELLQGCQGALAEQGEGFLVGASCGAVAIPDEATSASNALQLADQRMYVAKDATRSSSRRQMRDMLLQVLHEREPGLELHLRGVAAFAVAVGRALALTAEQLDEIARAAELHDVGKLAIPDAVLHKPGPLDDHEWRLMRQHTIIGERILAAAPALRPVGAIVRASHERVDGGGYPDALRGDAIPLGARIVAVCDAYDAMTTDRAYRMRMSQEDALSELQRCAGTQFDPTIVEVFARVVRADTARVDTPHPISL